LAVVSLGILMLLLSELVPHLIVVGMIICQAPQPQPMESEFSPEY